ncbi:hypothetical protein LJC13_00320 [Peptostreptococcaceae bacterium OttesenSCG-928-C18]|nr:hypothetical protein [Peptostreptococcaceae bacterium OttesenSCG-928-C18]
MLDGTPLVACPRFAVKVMTRNYIKIINKSKTRDKKILESFKKNFLPEKFLESYLKIADFMAEESIRNIVNAAFKKSEYKNTNNQSRILFIHGTKGNEILSKKSAIRMQKLIPKTKIKCFEGDPHCHKAIYEPEKWISVVADFLKTSLANANISPVK